MILEADLIRELDLTVEVPGKSDELDIQSSDINRPGLPLTGYWNYFAYQRPQIIGKVEMSYMMSLPPELLHERLERFFSYDIPCVIICYALKCPAELLEAARRSGTPVYSTTQETTLLVLKIINFLNEHLAPATRTHGVLVDVFGVGILITGDSGVGKSETALELVHRGHRLVADDSVTIRRVSATKIEGEAPEAIRHLMEIRGVGIVDISTMYGICAVIDRKTIHMVVHFELWSDTKEYDRLGLEDTYTEILGVKVPRLVIPIRPGRNLAVVLEVAARNLRVKQRGMSVAQLLDQRMRQQAGKAERSNEER